MKSFAPPAVDPTVAERQVQRYRTMSPADKLALADGLWDLAWSAAKAGVRLRNPTASDEDVEAEARALLLDASD